MILIGQIRHVDGYCLDRAGPSVNSDLECSDDVSSALIAADGDIEGRDIGCEHVFGVILTAEVPVSVLLQLLDVSVAYQVYREIVSGNLSVDTQPQGGLYQTCQFRVDGGAAFHNE